MNTYLRHLPILLVLLLLGCNASENKSDNLTQPEQQVIPVEKVEPIQKEEHINKEKIRKAFNKVEATILPFEVFNGEVISGQILDSILTRFVERKSHLSILDSVFTHEQMNEVNFNPMVLSEGEKYGRFLTTFETNIPNKTVSLFGFGKLDSENGRNANSLYIVVFNTTTLEIIDNTHIGYFYLPSVSHFSFSYEKGYMTSYNYQILEDLSIYTEMKYELTENTILPDIKKQRITQEGKIEEEPLIHYLNYDQYSYVEIEDSILVYRESAVVQYDEVFFDHLNIYGINIPKDTVITINNHLDVKWLDVFEYTTDAVISCKEPYMSDYYECSDAHFKEYFYNFIGDTNVIMVLEVKYKHLSDSILELKTRFSKEESQLQYEDWRVISLYHDGIYYHNSEDRGLISENWLFSYYFDDASDLPYDVIIEEVPPSPQEIKHEKFKVFLEQITKQIDALPQYTFNGESISDIKKWIAFQPSLFLEGKGVDSTWQFVTVPQHKKERNRAFCILFNPSNHQYYIVKYQIMVEEKFHVVDIKSLPENRPLYSLDNGIFTQEEKTEENMYTLLEKHWAFQVHEDVNIENHILKTVTFSEDDPGQIRRIMDINNSLDFKSIHDVVPQVKGKQKIFKDHYNRIWVNLKSYVPNKSGSYIKYIYSQDVNAFLDHVLEVQYTIENDGSILLNFRSSETKENLVEQAFVEYTIYPKEHKKHIRWKTHFFESLTLKDLKKKIKASK